MGTKQDSIIELPIAARQRARQGMQISKSVARKVADHERRIIAVEMRTTNLETAIGDLANINLYVGKIWRFGKWAGPLVATAAISSGIVSGRWGAFLHALVSGAT